MKVFQIGERVTFLNEQGQGTVKGFKSSAIVIVEDDFGFERDFPIQELVKIHSQDFQLGNPIPPKNEPTKRRNSSINEREELLSGTAMSSKYWEIDLHIEELIESHRGMTNAEILKHQMTEFKAFYNKALRHRISKLIVIHGVGEGVLKDEIRLFLARKEHIEFFDASYQEYGKGATEIRISQQLFNQE